ncbi:Hsp20/alpha crystallin family protein [Rubinisphaera margarita]|uniref:Hsp20/alpha crystallin family protein n=1 Tax=Rubinisphaera margarita TaxID=2909586 RepID=UPI001EE78F5B|nr:Hsp20/alpha crystallin family protein [Rubinisphaera margarita]MCG6157884.1 Hsp20/alpha crystallin family protein [Rubinisphaera margarita]
MSELQKVNDPQETSSDVQHIPESTHQVMTRPRTDIRETDQAYLLQADMPGIDESTAEVTVEKKVLTIRGTTQPYTPEGFENVYRESDQRFYERVFRLPEEVDPTALEATVKNGVLTVTLPKRQEAQPVRVRINAG